MVNLKITDIFSYIRDSKNGVEKLWYLFKTELVIGKVPTSRSFLTPALIFMDQPLSLLLPLIIFDPLFWPCTSFSYFLSTGRNTKILCLLYCIMRGFPWNRQILLNLWNPNENILKKKSIFFYRMIKVQILGGLLTDYKAWRGIWMIFDAGTLS